jgi:hypothetical protein
MEKYIQYVAEDAGAADAFINAFAIGGHSLEQQIRRALALHTQPFTICYKPAGFGAEAHPYMLNDTFSFDLDSNQLVLLDSAPETLLNAVIEMAMYQRGFETLLRVDTDADWGVQIAIGAWWHVRQHLKNDQPNGLLPRAQLELEIGEDSVAYYDYTSFVGMVYLASTPHLGVIFPEGSNAEAHNVYHRLCLLVRVIAFEIGLEDAQKFNARLRRVIDYISRELAPPVEESPFDRLLGRDGQFDSSYFLAEDEA